MGIKPHTPLEMEFLEMRATIIMHTSEYVLAIIMYMGSLLATEYLTAELYQMEQMDSIPVLYWKTAIHKLIPMMVSAPVNNSQIVMRAGMGIWDSSVVSRPQTVIAQAIHTVGIIQATSYQIVCHIIIHYLDMAIATNYPAVIPVLMLQDSINARFCHPVWLIAVQDSASQVVCICPLAIRHTMDMMDLKVVSIYPIVCPNGMTIVDLGIVTI
jgi:hypothetical protein